MIEISSKDIENYNKLGSGAFGTVFQVDENTAYKIYHDEVKVGYDKLKENPMLKENRSRIKRIISKNEKVVYTDFVKDTILLDGKFKGVSISYHDGDLLLDKINYPFNYKLEMAKELIRNGIELNNNRIYNRDYKLNNIVCTKNGLKIIDLDDVMTVYSMIKNPFLQNEANTLLFDTVLSFMENKIVSTYSKGIKKELEKVNFVLSGNYHEIYNYINYISITKNVILLSDLIEEDIAKYIKENRYKVIFLHNANYNDDNYFMNIIMEFRKMGIELYDFVSFNELDNYLITNNVRVRKL